MTREERLDLLAAAELTAASDFAREHDEWHAVECHVDTSDFAPEILPRRGSEAFDVITEPTTVRRVRVTTDLSWSLLDV